NHFNPLYSTPPRARDWQEESKQEAGNKSVITCKKLSVTRVQNYENCSDEGKYSEKSSCDSQPWYPAESQIFSHRIRVVHVLAKQNSNNKIEALPDSPNRLMFWTVEKPLELHISQHPSAGSAKNRSNFVRTTSSCEPVIEDTLRVACSSEEESCLEQLEIDADEIREKANDLASYAHAKWHNDLRQYYYPDRAPDTEILLMQSDVHNLRNHYEDALLFVVLFAKRQKICQAIMQLNALVGERAKCDEQGTLDIRKEPENPVPYCAN
ncbi:hypothetical protein BIW11_09323, partial [Tropilaelaps mercedesae]